MVAAFTLDSTHEKSERQTEVEGRVKWQFNPPRVLSRRYFADCALLENFEIRGFHVQGMVKTLWPAAGNEPKHDCARFKLTKPSTPFNVIPPSFVLNTPGYNANKQSHSFLCSYS